MRMEYEVFERASKRYGEPLPAPVQKRLQAELGAILENGHEAVFTAAQQRMERARMRGRRAVSRGYAGASAAAFFLGITEVNPLPPHYFCPLCRFSSFADGVTSGFDLPPKACPRCGEPLQGDGHDLPFEALLGADGRRRPHIELYVSRDELQNEPEPIKERSAPPLLSVRPHPVPELYRELEAMTGVPVSDVPPWGANACRLLLAAAATGKIPGMEKPRLHRLLREKRPQTMGELAHGYGLAHRTAVPFSRSEESRVSEEFGTREDVLRYVISKGIGRKQAFDIAEQAASGKAAAEGFAPGVEELLKKHGVPEAYVQDCKKIGYLYAEAHIIAYLIDGFRIAWYYERLGELP